MPVYDYWCDDCGPFEALAPMAKYNDPCSCPTCGAESQRVMLNAPGISLVQASTRRAHETNERSANSPKRASEHGLSRPEPKRRVGARTVVGPDGTKCFPTKRSWMLSH